MGPIKFRCVHACPFDPQVFNDKKVSDQCNGDWKADIVKPNEDAENVNDDQTSDRSDVDVHWKQQLTRDVEDEHQGMAN